MRLRVLLLLESGDQRRCGTYWDQLCVCVCVCVCVCRGVHLRPSKFVTSLGLISKNKMETTAF